MTTFYGDADLAGAGQFNDPELALGLEFTVPAGSATFRWRAGTTPPGVVPVLRLWNAANQLVVSLPFATVDAGAWNAAVGSVDLAAGTYVASVNTDHYTARTGFFTVPIVRGDITGVSGRFGSSPTSAPGGTSTAAYFVDVDFTAEGTEPEPEPEPEPDPVVDEPRVGESMHLARVMDEVALAMATIQGLNGFAYPPATLTAPAFYISYPAQILYDVTYARGEDDFIDLPIVVLVGRPTQRETRDRVARYCASDGPTSVKAALEGFAWTTCDSLSITTAEFDTEMIAGVEYLALIFKATAVGPGRE